MRPFTIIAVVTALAACAPAATTTTAPGPAPGAVQERTAELWPAETHTILTGEAAQSLAHQCSRIAPGPVESTWTPSEADVDALEGELMLLVARQLEARGESPSPGDYYRQYAGFVIDGKRVIYVNGVAESAIQSDPNPAHPFDWRTQAVSICDGGSITFGVEYDPVARAFSNFAFNGAI